METIDNQKLKLSDFKGKIVVVDFMAMWCKPCRAQIAILADLWPKYRDKGVVFMSVDVDPMENLTQLKIFAEKCGMTWIVGCSGKAGEIYGIVAVPTIVIVDRNGQIVVKHTGVISGQRLSEILDSILKE